jgi:hypothetical protein
MQAFNQKEKEKEMLETIKNIAKQSNSFILSPCSIRRFDLTSVRQGSGLLSCGFFLLTLESGSKVHTDPAI